jgi:hypothetical protein
MAVGYRRRSAGRQNLDFRAKEGAQCVGKRANKRGEALHFNGGPVHAKPVSEL